MGVRAGQGYGSRKPKRAVCPECHKKGVTQFQAIPGGQVRYCQYCQASWGVSGWHVATASTTDKDIEPRFQLFLNEQRGNEFNYLAAERKAFYAGFRAAIAAQAGEKS